MHISMKVELPTQTGIYNYKYSWKTLLMDSSQRKLRSIAENNFIISSVHL